MLQQLPERQKISKENLKIISEANLLENFDLNVEKGDASLVIGINTVHDFFMIPWYMLKTSYL